MLYVYLFAAVMGGALLMVSALGGDHDDGDGAADDLVGLLSLRLWTYVLGFGGATGLLLTLMGAAGPALTAVLAALVGGGTGVGAQMVIRRALRAGGGGTVRDDELAGKSAEVLVPFGKGQSGMVRLTVKGSTVDMVATCEDDELAVRDEVLIVEVVDGRAIVARSPLSKAALPARAGQKETR